MAISNARLTRRRRSSRSGCAASWTSRPTVQRNLLPPAQDDARIDPRPVGAGARRLGRLLRHPAACPAGATAFALADVSGKGMNAALIMVKAATLFRSLGKRRPRAGPAARAHRARAVRDHEPRHVRDHGRRHLRRARARGAFQQRRARAAAAARRTGGYTALPRARIRRWASSCAWPTTATAKRGIDAGRRQRSTCSPTASPKGMRVGRRPLGVDGLRVAHRRACAARTRAGAPAGHRRPDAGRRRRAARRPDADWSIEDACAGASTRRSAAGAGAAWSRWCRQTHAGRGVSQLTIVRRLVEAAARQVGGAPRWAPDLALAVDEACQNIIRHAYGGRVRRADPVARAPAPTCLEVELVDFAPAG